MQEVFGELRTSAKLEQWMPQEYGQYIVHMSRKGPGEVLGTGALLSSRTGSEVLLRAEDPCQPCLDAFWLIRSWRYPGPSTGLTTNKCKPLLPISCTTTPLARQLYWSYAAPVILGRS